MFLLSAAQFQMPLDDEIEMSLLTNAGITADTVNDADKLAKIMSEMKCIQEIIVKCKQAQVDNTEYACLKAMTLFKTCMTHIFIDCFLN